MNCQLQIENLEPSICASLTSHIHGKQFFNKKVFVTSVVQKTPTKDTDTARDCPNPLVNSSESDTSDESENEESSTSKTPCSKLFSIMSRPEKRGAQHSPEDSANNKKDKKKPKKSTATDNASASSTAAVRSSSRNGKHTKQ